MKKIVAFVLLPLFTCLCFAHPTDYRNEKYDSLVKEEKYDEVISAIEAEDESSYSASDCFYLGMSYFRIGNDEEAQKYLGAAIQKSPDFLEAYDYLAGSYYYTEKYELAIQNLKKCIELDGTYAHAYEKLGNVYEMIDDYQSALENYSKSYELEKKAAVAGDLAWIYFKIGEYKKAKSYGEAYLKQDKNSFPMVNMMIIILYSEGEYNKAEKYEKQLREICKNSDDEDLKNAKYFMIHSFSYKDYNIDVYEKIDQTGDFYYPLTCQVWQNNNVIKTVNIEFDALTKEFGCPYFLGINDLKTNAHSTMAGFKKIPPFEDFIEYVKMALDGELEEAASSRRTKK